MVDAVAAKVPREKLAAHFHDTYGQSLANIMAVMERGVAVFDTAVEAPAVARMPKGAQGNVGTEDVIYLMNGLGIAHGVDLDAVATAGRDVCVALGPNLLRRSRRRSRRRRLWISPQFRIRQLRYINLLVDASPKSASSSIPPYWLESRLFAARGCPWNSSSACLPTGGANPTTLGQLSRPFTPRACWLPLAYARDRLKDERIFPTAA